MADSSSTFSWGDSLPTIDGGAVALRRLVAQDVPDLFAVFSDPAVMRYWDGAPMASMAEAQDYLAEIDEGFRTRVLFQWGIALPPDGRIIGTCTLLRLAAAHGRGEIGFAVGKGYWGRGYGTAAVSALIHFAFGELALHRLEADVDPRNERSLRLLERLGFTREGYLRERYAVGGELQDSVILGLLRREWAVSQERTGSTGGGVSRVPQGGSGPAG
jgi:RimJ/RimL family protein N-acetyltransferase